MAASSRLCCGNCWDRFLSRKAELDETLRFKRSKCAKGCKRLWRVALRRDRERERRTHRMTLNKRQMLAFRCGVALIVLMGLFPPWVYTRDARSVHSRKSAGYYFIFTPPAPEYNYSSNGVRLDVSRLLIQWLVVATSVAGFFLISKKQVASASRGAARGFGRN